MKYSYAVIYIVFVLIGHLWSILLGSHMSFIGLTSVYDLPYYIILIYHYIIIKLGVFYKLEKDARYQKKEIQKSYLILTSLFNIIFFFLYLKDSSLFLFVSIINIFLILFLKPKKEKITATTQKNIENYFKNQRSREK